VNATKSCEFNFRIEFKRSFQAGTNANGIQCFVNDTDRAISTAKRDNSEKVGSSSEGGEITPDGIVPVENEEEGKRRKQSLSADECLGARKGP
jgi:hypothetical protein